MMLRFPDQAVSNALLHELGNCVTSIEGCAELLVEHASKLTPEQARELNEVVLKQSKRLEWIVRAMALADGTDRGTSVIDLATVVRDATRTPRATVVADADDLSVRVEGEEATVRAALEALLLALTDAGQTARARVIGRDIEVESSATDVSRSGPLWKLALARTLLERHGASLWLHTGDVGTTVSVQFAPAKVSL
jgi:signal transduction histidine kinase